MQKYKSVYLGVLFLALFGVFSLLLSTRPISARAASFVVNSTTDSPDISVGDGICSTGSGNCTLRAALEEANATTGTNPISITFAIPGAGVQTISLTQGLPSINRSNITIDGSTQPGSSCGNLWGGVEPVWNVVIQGNGAENLRTGFDIHGSGVSIRGVSVTGFTYNSGAAFAFRGGYHSGISCSSVSGNYYGINLEASSTASFVGGPNPGDGNVIGGNVGDHHNQGDITIHYNVSGTVIQGNFIGIKANGRDTYPTGTAAIVDQGDYSQFIHNLIGGIPSDTGELLGMDGRYAQAKGNYIGVDKTGLIANQGFCGVGLTGFHNTVGGTTPADRNIIGGSFIGVCMAPLNNYSNSENTVLGNYIGVGADGVTPVPNQYGIVLGGANLGNAPYGVGQSNNVFTGNVIAYNANEGFTTLDPVFSGFLGDSGTGNAVLGNSIYENGGIGIDLSHPLGPQGVTPNDPLDSDTGPNNFQNYPVITKATAYRTRTVVRGTLQSTPKTTFRLEFFWTPEGKAAQGKVFLGSVQAKTSIRGKDTFVAARLPRVPGPGKITATATDSGNNTSEFSVGVPVKIAFTLPDNTEPTVDSAIEE